MKKELPIKNKIHHAKSVSEAINDLQGFLDCDLYSKFKPIMKLPSREKGKVEIWYREDIFSNEKEFREYLQTHFDILRKEIRRLKK